MYTARNEAHWFQTVEQWKRFCLHWGALDLSTVSINSYRWGHSEGARLEIPENIFEEDKLIKKGKKAPLLPTYQRGYEPVPTYHYARRVEISPLWPRTNPRDVLLTPTHPPSWIDDNPQDEDMRPGLFPQDLVKTPHKGDSDERNPEKEPIRGLSDGDTKAGGNPKKEEKEEVSTPNPENFWSQYTPAPLATSKTIPESYVAPPSEDNATKYIGLNALKGIELTDMYSAPAIKKWWKAVEAYEKLHGDWNRALIDPLIKDRIDARWMHAKLWLSCLPAEIQKAYNGTWRPTRLELMNPKIISSQKL